MATNDLDIDTTAAIWYDRRTAPKPTNPTITLQKGGALSASNSSYERMGKPPAVRLGYLPATNMILIEPAQKDTPGAYPVRSQNNRSSTWVISASSFCRTHGVRTDVARRYGAQFKGKTLIVDLNSESVDIISPRTVGKANADGKR